MSLRRGGNGSAVPAACRRRRVMAADGQAGHCRRPAAGGRRAHGGGQKGERTPMVSFPSLDSPNLSFKPRLPSVARLKARGPQGRLVLQGHTLDGSGAFRSGTLPPCTVWPRTVMRGGSRKVNSGHNSVPKANRRTEPSPRNPRFAAHLRCVSAKEGQGSQEGTGNHWCPVPFCPTPWARRLPGRRRRPNVHAHLERKVASSGAPLYRRKVSPLLTVKKKRAPSPGREKGPLPRRGN